MTFIYACSKMYCRSPHPPITYLCLSTLLPVTMMMGGDAALEENATPSRSSSDPDPNHNSLGVSAAESARHVEEETDLRVPCYCKENVWRLVHRKLQHMNLDDGTNTSDESGPSSVDYWAVFVSNPVKNVPMFHQRAASSPSAACCWDYHVILFARDLDGSSVLVWDMDSTLAYPSPLRTYLDRTFPYDWPDPHGPQFRLVPAPVFRNTFASNRSHMYNVNQRKWSAPPPPYDVIQTDADTHTLPYLLDFAERHRNETHRRLSECGALGRIFSLRQVREHTFL
jgi:protein N-terminal glutamine amidohydrolase